jgi:predicted ABC-type transport system involved in lysophospholipase L1 biosynthesis ATPase subunit
MLQHALNLDMVILPGDTAWPAPLSLAVAFNEVVLIEGAGPAVSSPLLEVAATLAAPVGGHVRHWGREAALLRRERLYRLRRRIAYISPQQVLLHLISLAENIALSPCYYQGCSQAEALAPHADLLEHLELQARLNLSPTQVSAATYARAQWARELVKEPVLILAVISGDLATNGGATRLADVLRVYLARYRSAALLLGESLEAFYPLGHRLFLLESGQLRQRTILEHRARPLTAYLPLF